MLAQVPDPASDPPSVNVSGKAVDDGSSTVVPAARLEDLEKAACSCFLASHMSSRAQVLGLISSAFSGALAGSSITRGVARTQTGASTMAATQAAG